MGYFVYVHAYSGYWDRLCPHCKDSIPVSQSYPQHLLSQHLTDFDLNTIRNYLENKDLFKLADAISSLHSIISNTLIFVFSIYILLEIVQVASTCNLILYRVYILLS